MKIGILTLHYGFNYGGVLQCYALKRTLEQMGHKAIILDRIPKCFGNLYTFKRKYCHPFTHPEFADFRKHFMTPISTPLRSSNDLNRELTRGYDACIVGSDQVWRKGVFDVNGDYFLQHINVPGLKKIAYAASFGHDTWDYSDEETKSISDALNLFDYISVREADAVDLLQKHCNIKSEHVLDPTLLANPEIYTPLRQQSDLTAKGKIVTYILDWSNEIFQYCSRVSKELSLELIHLNPPPFSTDSSTRKKYTVYDWIQLLATSDKVITDSFHGSVFSAIYKKPVNILGNKSRGNSRFTSLLKTFNISSNVDTSSKFLHIDQNTCITNKRISTLKSLHHCL